MQPQVWGVMKLCSITTGCAGDIELRVYEIDHSAASLKPKAEGLADRLRSSRAFEMVKKFSDGIEPRNFQLLTAESPTPASAATAVVPPKASTMSSTDLSMPDVTSRFVKMSSLHAPRMDREEKRNFNKGMDSPQDIGRRLDLWLKAEIELRRNGDQSLKSAADLCRLLDISESAWSQYKAGKAKQNGVVVDRPITLEVADQLCHEFGLTLDWIYRNDVERIDLGLRRRMAEIERRPRLVRGPKKI